MRRYECSSCHHGISKNQEICDGCGERVDTYRELKSRWENGGIVIEKEYVFNIR